MRNISDSSRAMFGVTLAPMRIDDAVELAAVSIDSRRPLLFGMVNAAKLVKMRQEPPLFRAVVAADVILADGMSVVWASRLLGCPLPERVAGIDLMSALLREAERRGWRVYFLGATEEALAKALEKVLEDHPRLAVAGARDGYFSEDEERGIVDSIKETQPDILLVGMSSPKKERFLARWADECGAPVCHGVGGSFDVLAGLVQRAPGSWQRAGLEWLWRVSQEPGRLWRRYLHTNTAFASMVAEAALARVVPFASRAVDDARWAPADKLDEGASGANRAVASLEDGEDARSVGSSRNG